MKNNTEQTKNLLNQSLSHLPHDNSLVEARNYIKMAIDSIEKVEKKRMKRENVKQKRLKSTKISNYDPKKSLIAIEREINNQKSKLQKQSDEDIFLS